MAYQIPVLDITLVAGQDLQESQFRGVAISEDGEAVLPNHTDAETVLGFLQNDPEEGEAASIRVYGVTKAIASTTDVNYGTEVEVDADGRISDAGDDDVVLGIALLDAGATDDVVSVLLTHQGIISSA